jgi:hypothetical protein
VLRILLVEPATTTNSLAAAIGSDDAWEMRRVCYLQELNDTLESWRPQVLLFSYDIPLSLKDLFFGYWRSLPGAPRVIDVVEEGREAEGSIRAQALLVVPAEADDTSARLQALLAFAADSV